MIVLTVAVLMAGAQGHCAEGIEEGAAMFEGDVFSRLEVHGGKWAASQEVEILDLVGRRVRTVFSGAEGSGAYIKVWDGRDYRDELLPVGVYVVKVVVHTEQGTFVRTRTVAIVY